MEVRNLVEKAPELDISNELSQIFTLGKSCIDPADIGNLDKIRLALHDMTKNLILPWDCYKFNLIIFINNDNKTSENKIKYLFQFNYELSKTFDKLINLMVLSNVGADDILNYYETLLTEMQLKDTFFFPENALQTITQFSRHCNILLKIYNNPEVNLRPNIYNEEAKSLGIGDAESFIKSGRILNDGFLGLLTQQMWDTSFYFNKLALLMDNYDPSTDQKTFHLFLMEGWLHYFRMLDLLGNDWDSIGRLYSVINYIKTDKPKTP